MRTIKINPSDKQRQFLTDTHRHVAYGGARGGGKSWAVRIKAFLLCGAWAGIKVLIVRRSYKELYNNHIVPLRSLLHGVARYNNTDKVFTFETGSAIYFGYCDNDGDLLQYQGAEYDVIFFDEAAQLQENWLRDINVTVRGVNSFPKRTYYTLNPGGPSHGYFKRLFIDRRFEGEEKPEDYSFIQALVTDNKALMQAQPEYLSNLKSLPPAQRAAWLEGRWDVFEGQFFEEFRDDPAHYEDRRFTHVIAPFEPDAGWRIYRSYDFGYGKPFSCAWWAVDYDGVLYRILELYGWTGEPNEGVKWSPDRQFEEIRRTEREHPWLRGKEIQGVADPAIWDASHGESIAQTAARYGVYFSKGDNARIPGWMQVHYRLQFDENGYARMYFFKGCDAIIRTMPMMMYSKTHVEDLDTTMEDHCLTGETLVLTADGYKPISELVGTEGWTYSSDGALHRYYDVRRTRENAQIIEIELEDGTTIRCTDDHRFMLPSGEWIYAHDLAAGMEVKTIGCTGDQQHSPEI